MTIFENLHNDEKEFNGQREKSEIIEPAVQEKNVRQTTFMLIAAIAVVLAVVWFIHKKTTPAQTIAAVTDQQLQIEAAITQMTGIKAENVSQVDQLVKRFYEFADFGQVTSQQLRRNPFNSSWIAAEAMTVSSALNDNNGEMKNNAQNMQLQSILQSKYGNCCMIDDTLLYKGDKINGFKIAEIGNDFVRLEGQGFNRTLYLQTE